jgi:RimJ/RimL family protein N-acetyltransferase
MIQIIPVKKCEIDGKLIMKWRNDPITRTNSINSDLKVWSTFKDEFYGNYFKNIPLFAEKGGVKIAFVSFVYDHGDLIVGINLDPDQRGKKLSVPILNEAINYIMKNYSYIGKIKAYIKGSNIPSIKLFTRVGFKLVDDSRELKLYELKL